MAIVTLTLNPAIDISCEIPGLVPWHKLRCGPVRRDPGGGGINVARALTRFGEHACAVFASGGPNGKFLEEALTAAGVDHLAVGVAGNTRENITVYDKQTSLQYRLVFPGDPLSEEEAEKCCRAALERSALGGYLIASGSLQPGVAPAIYGKLAGRAREKGAKFVLDASGEALRYALDSPIAVLKASEKELMEALRLRDRSQLASAARQLLSRGAGLVAVTGAGQGAILVGPGFALAADAPALQPLTSVGAGDSFLAGLILELSRGRTPEIALRTAVASGSASLLYPGTALCQPDMVEKLKPRVRIRNALPALAIC